jgi:NADH:ubiquinone oxidoreductase subunit C|uniref:NADH dehydrogenase subunit 9 n=1 Tax=Vermamoeba vermiformis TaxID=5778 RepID=A0A0K1HP53_VERVE|nr:NADH dehydrogenase subunit 9 [Vermamoeba vermiformis]
MDEGRSGLVSMILNLLTLIGNWVTAVVLKPNFAILIVKPKYLKNLLIFFKYFFGNNFSTLMDVWGSDYPHRIWRFEVNFLILNLSLPYRIVLRTFTNEYIPISSVSDIYSSSGWLEREVWDMYGVYFSGHKDLRRILTDYGFSGYPLRKDFPLTGYTEVRYDDTKKQVVLEPLEVSQELRLFNFKSPWENNYID